ncbi:cytosolic regulator pianissimo [Microthyrium microscopicum]|uniref:Cytosolic regulator pianissimo n=1 Tax=Microthyrium microscopicum TaxID=703497 RepID=A0A6A6UNV5_9PEZI|nr:cytosolic regulator pianissimo [Microthyrium microscopicum]
MFAGSFSSAMTLRPGEALSRPELPAHSSYAEEDMRAQSEKRQAELREEIDKETKILIGSEKMLEALNAKGVKGGKEQKRRVEDALNTANRKLLDLRLGLDAEIQRSKEIYGSADAGISSAMRSHFARPLSRQGYAVEPVHVEEEMESPTLVLSELLEALETGGMKPEYYVENMNQLVELFKRHPQLRYDLAWSIFGLRMQAMLLSDSREVVAAGYRVLRYSITDRQSLQVIQDLNTDYNVILSLVKDSKASVEREQALKFVRAFLDVKGGVRELSPKVVRIVVAVAGHSDDRLRNIAILTLAELLVRAPELLVKSGGLGTLTEALAQGSYRAAQSLTGAFIYLLDTPARRKYLRSGHELDIPLSTFGASPLAEAPDEKAHESQLRASAKVITSLLRSWPGLITFSINDFSATKSLVASLYIPMISVRTVLLELFTDILRIKPPSWSSSFLAGRRLTTYARVTNLKAQNNLSDEPGVDDSENQRNLVDHFTAVVLGVLLHSGLLTALLHAEEEPLTLPLKRKTSLLLGEVLKMANELLPTEWAASLQVLPHLLKSGLEFGTEERFVSLGTLYQIDSVNRTLYRSEPSLAHPNRANSVNEALSHRKSEQTKAAQNMQMDEAQFRTMMLDSGVLNTVTFTKWRWDIIQNIIDGPLRNPKRLDEAIRSTKFLHRLLGFYRPFKWRFSDVKNTKPNQRYVRIGCALMQTLVQNPEGVKHLLESKLIRQLAECLSHFDRLSGLTSEQPLFSASRLAETLVGGYFALLGALSSKPSGLLILERWNIFNMFYHIVELRDRDDLVKALLSGMDYTLDSHLRIILSKAMTSGSKDVRIFATRLLRKYATLPLTEESVRTVEWAIRLLATQLFDPEIEVCEIAIKILEEACRQKHSLEYIVKCRPALDHLGEIGAPLLLRFLSTSVGYQYLDELDYITREMDDWFLGRNDTYVAVIEASLAHALASDQKTEKPTQQYPLYNAYDDSQQAEPEYGVVPPHFYRELTRTAEGCKLLASTGHFDQFATTLADWGMEDDDSETILKVKGCLWAVANVGSMELGAPFLEQSDVVRYIVRIAEESEVMTLRGTAFFALGLISRSLHGQEILAEFGWDSTTNMRGESLGFCMPLEFSRLFKIKSWRSPAVDPDGVRGPTDRTVLSEHPNPTIARVLKCVAMLGNTVLSKRAAGELNTIKARKPALFQSPSLFLKVLAVLESHHYHHQMWYFCMNLFGKSVIRHVILDEDDSDVEDDDDPALYEHALRARGVRANTMSSNGRSTAASFRTADTVSEEDEDESDDDAFD